MHYVNIYTNTSGVVVVQKWGPYSVPMATNICMSGLKFLRNVCTYTHVNSVSTWKNPSITLFSTNRLITNMQQI